MHVYNTFLDTFVKTTEIYDQKNVYKELTDSKIQCEASSTWEESPHESSPPPMTSSSTPGISG